MNITFVTVNTLNLLRYGVKILVLFYYYYDYYIMEKNRKIGKNRKNLVFLLNFPFFSAEFLKA